MISRSIYDNSDYSISDNMKYYVGILLYWFTINKLKLNIENTNTL